MGKKCYFIEGPTDNDLIGFNSYVDSLENAIEDEAKFIGLISDFGTGKSSVLNMLKKKNENNYDLKTINLWECNEECNEDNLNIHMVFLHQLIDKLNLKNSDYYKKKINKNYRLFDFKVKNNNKFYLFFLCLFYLLYFIQRKEIFIFINDYLLEELFIILFGSLILFCILIYEPLLSFDKQNSNRVIDENDTKDLYREIIDDYFGEKSIFTKFKNKKKKKLILCIEEVDRYNNIELVLQYLKEFYKFYKESNHDVVFIIALKSASKMAELNEPGLFEMMDNKVYMIKSTYEKLFDFILNLNRVNIQDYDSIIIDLVKSIPIEDRISNVHYPVRKLNNAWRYLYKGESISIRDIKHRFNFAMSLYQSIIESGFDADEDKCFYISYLEDEYNDLYYKLTNNYFLINNLLIEYSNKKNIDSDRVLSNKERKVFIEGIENGYIDSSYVYYFFKFPKNKKPLNIYELELKNAIFFDRDTSNLKLALEKIKEASKINMNLKNRVNKDLFPEIVFSYKKLFMLSFKEDYNALLNTLIVKCDPLLNYDKFYEIFSKITKYNFIGINRIYNDFFESYKNKINDLPLEERFNLRLNLVRIFKSNINSFDYLFYDNNLILSGDEMNIIKNINIIEKMTNYEMINDDFILNIKPYLKQMSKTSMLRYLNNLSLEKNIDEKKYNSILSGIDFSSYHLNKADIRKIYNYSSKKIPLMIFDKLIGFIKRIKLIDDYIDEKVNMTIDYNKTDQVQDYISCCEDYDYFSKKMIDIISKSSYLYRLNDNTINKLFDLKYYKKYIEYIYNKNKVLIFETDKVKALRNDYINYFIENSSGINVDDSMKEFLLDYLDLANLNQQQLLVFSSYKQTKEMIDLVLHYDDKDFINSYFYNIISIEDKDRMYIAKKLSSYHINKGFDTKSLRRIKRIYKNDKEVLELFYKRKKKINDIS